MPAKQLPDVESFEAFARALLRRGFRKIQNNEFVSDSLRLALCAPSPRQGRETGFTFSAHGLEVIVWTTFLEREGYAREQDAGWVLIREGDIVQYFSRPHSRTKNFLHTMLLDAALARLRVLNRPMCPVCGRHMSITFGKGFKSRFWQCVRPEFHKRPENLSWDFGLPEEALRYLKPIRQARRRYQMTLKKLGKASGAALKRRVGWKVGNRHNVRMPR